LRLSGVGLPGLRLASIDEPNSFLEPRCGPGLVDLSGRDRQHGFFGLVDVGRSGSQMPSLRSINMTSAAQAARLFPSVRGWFHASRHTNTAALS
jgi:hypothetical protein